jgi:hypothetical protein
VWYSRVPQKLIAFNFFPEDGVYYILQHTDTYLSEPRSSTFISTFVLRTSDTTATANYSVVSLLRFSLQCNQGSLSFGMWHYFAENATFHLKSVSLLLMQTVSSNDDTLWQILHFLLIRAHTFATWMIHSMFLVQQLNSTTFHGYVGSYALEVWSLYAFHDSLLW